MVKCGGGKYFLGVLFKKWYGKGRKRFGVGWRGRKNWFLKKFGCRGNWKGYGKGRGFGNKIGRCYYGFWK